MQRGMFWLFFVLGSALAAILALQLFPSIWVREGGVTDWLGELFGFFRDKQTAWALSLAILVAGGLSVVWFFLRESLPHRRSLRRALRIVGASAGPAGFAADYETLRQQIEEQCPRLHHAWTEFDETLLKPGPEGAGLAASGTPPVIRNTQRPQAYFNLSALVESGFHLPFWHAMPNYFVGFGLLCTFIGLVAGLHAATSGLDGASIEETKKALTGLLEAATFKFLTSIAGVLVSLMLAVTVRREVSVLSVHINAFCLALETRMQFVTVARIAHDQWLEQKKLPEFIEKFRTDFAVQLADAINQRMTDSVTKMIVGAIEKLEAAIRSNAGDAAHGTAAAVVKELSGPLLNLSESIARLSTSTADAVGKVNEFSATYAERLQATTELFERGIASAAERIESAASSVAGTLGKGGETMGKAASTALEVAVAEFNNAVQPLVDGLRGLGTTLTAMDKSLNEQRAHTERTKAGLDQTITSLAQVAGQFDSAGRALEASALPVREASVALASATQQSEQTLKGLENLAVNAARLSEAIQNSQATLANAWEEYRGRFEGTDEALKKTFDSLMAGVEEWRGEVESFVSKLDEHLERATTTLGGAVEGLSETVEDLSAALRQAPRR